MKIAGRGMEPTKQALLALSTSLVHVPPANDVADLELGHAVPDLLDGPDTLVPEDHVGVFKVLVGATYPRVSNFDKDFVSCRAVAARRAFDYARVR
jgi:hypothetical protein